MTLAERLEQLIFQLQHHLTAWDDELVTHLKTIQTGKGFTYTGKCMYNDIACFYFEYEYDYLDIAGWATDTRQYLVTDTFLPLKDTRLGQDNKWNYLLPESIYRAQAELQKQYKDEEDAWDNYHSKKDRVLTDWFRNGWLKAAKETGAKHDAYFSIHDTYWRTDLQSGQELNDDEIAKRYE